MASTNCPLSRGKHSWPESRRSITGRADKKRRRTTTFRWRRPRTDRRTCPWRGRTRRARTATTRTSRGRVANWRRFETWRRIWRGVDMHLRSTESRSRRASPHRATNATTWSEAFRDSPCSCKWPRNLRSCKRTNYYNTAKVILK